MTLFNSGATRRTAEQRKAEFEECCIKLTQTQIAGMAIPTPPALKTMIEIYIEAEEAAAKASS